MINQSKANIYTHIYIHSFAHVRRYLNPPTRIYTLVAKRLIMDVCQPTVALSSYLESEAEKNSIDGSVDTASGLALSSAADSCSVSSSGCLQVYIVISILVLANANELYLLCSVYSCLHLMEL